MTGAQCIKTSIEYAKKQLRKKYIEVGEKMVDRELSKHKKLLQRYRDTARLKEELRERLTDLGLDGYYLEHDDQIRKQMMNRIYDEEIIPKAVVDELRVIDILNGIGSKKESRERLRALLEKEGLVK